MPVFFKVAANAISKHLMVFGMGGSLKNDINVLMIYLLALFMPTLHITLFTCDLSNVDAQ